MGLHTSVKAHLNLRRLNLAVETDTVHEENETINTTFTEPQATGPVDTNTPDPPAPSVLEASMSMASTSYGNSICGDNIPCLPTLSSAAKSMASYGTRTTAESPPPNRVNSISKVASVSVPSTPQTDGEILMFPDLKSFYFSELERATRNFHPDNKVDEGGFGRVFKGLIEKNSLTAAKPGSGIVIAVKRIRQESFEGQMDWSKKVNYLRKLHHQNLVKLIGYCFEDDDRVLVYEFAPLGSLHNHLFGGTSDVQRLSWNLRMKIALGAATGLLFFHSYGAKSIYGNFNPSKILLDSNYNVKLCGYGFAKERLDRWRRQVILPWYEDRVGVSAGNLYAGTAGNLYAAPECINLLEDQLTPASDVYSFGVVLLELLSGRRAFDFERSLRQRDLVQLVKKFKSVSKYEVDQIFDAHIEGQYPERGAQKALALVLLCLQETEFRISMNVVVKVLKPLYADSGEGHK